MLPADGPALCVEVFGEVPGGPATGGGFPSFMISYN